MSASRLGESDLQAAGAILACSEVENVTTAKGGMFMSSVGYTMRDIRYKWNEGPNSVGVSSEVSLPQFKVLGHRQKAMEISLTTGTVFPKPALSQVRDILMGLFH